LYGTVRGQWWRSGPWRKIQPSDSLSPLWYTGRHDGHSNHDRHTLQTGVDPELGTD
jgi:hypothetical protein